MSKCIELKPLQSQDVEKAHEMEVLCFPEDEADPLHRFVSRHKEAPLLYFGHFEDGKLLGFICATRYVGENMSKQSMCNHIEDGESVCVHSVCVHPDHRNQGIARNLLKRYVSHIWETQRGVARILLLSHAHLIPFYSSVGFTLVGKSSVVLGKEEWYEFKMSME